MTDTELEELFVETSKRHHAAFIEADGVDPEWPLFYAAYVQTRLWDRLGVLLTRSELVHVMVAADLALSSGSATGDWPSVFAARVRAFAESKTATL
ncbi:MAG: hypothetical protein OEY55_07305 [Acidimicrobiia bacterium]|nr:hypothetical protein [Acidimicrobiia bacterium]MDH5421595.1 hypothetical protein [Acidimicrobiia bacterium]MDH5505076.1 hypothetical protein [Acidimicrobiia bacterium]